MSLSIEQGRQSAKQMARASSSVYVQAQRLFGRVIDPYLGDAPKALGLAHLVRVNPKLETAPTPAKDRRRGFMRATVTMAQTAGVAWEDLDEPTTCAYVWGRDINADAKSLYLNNISAFPTIGSNFWKCSYLKHVLGDAAFGALWLIRDTSQSTVYDSLLSSVADLKRMLYGWSPVKLKHAVFLGCEYTFEMTKRGGGMNSSGYGLEPVLSKNNYQQVFK